MAAILGLLLCGCIANTTAEPNAVETPVASAEEDLPADAAAEPSEAPLPRTWQTLRTERELLLEHAVQFRVSYCADGFKKVTIGDGEQYLVVPEGCEIPTGVPDDVTILQQPLDRIYLVTSASMDYFRALNEIGAIRLSGLRQDGWYLPEAAAAMERGEILYAGKYSAPDYELILSEDCDLAIENTMIYHSPKVMEQLRSFEIPVLVDRSSYESDPLGRMEWIKLYAALLNKEAEAEAFYAAQMAQLEPILHRESTGKRVAFFYITSSGAVSIRKPGDYIAKAIALAGGEYVFADLGGETDAQSTMTIQMEAFYAEAKMADVLIYNSTINGELKSMDDLVEMSDLLADCKAVQTGNVWCTGKNMYQESLGIGSLIRDIHAVLTGEGTEDLTFLTQLK